MALYFLSRSMQPIYLSIFGASVYRHLSKKVASYDTKTMEVYKANADEIELNGRRILDLSDTKSQVCEMQVSLFHDKIIKLRPENVVILLVFSVK